MKHLCKPQLHLQKSLPILKEKLVPCLGVFLPRKKRRLAYLINKRKKGCQVVLPESDRDTYCEYQLEMVSSYLPTPISEYIIERFCDDMDVNTYKMIDFDSPCKVCLAKQKRLLKRRHLEKQLISKNENKDAPAFFLISQQWLVMQWNMNICLDTDDDKMKHYFFDSFDLPSSIDNSSLFDEDGEELIENLKENSDFYFVNCFVFEIFERLYGVDKAVGRAEKSLKSAAVDYSRGNVGIVDQLEEEDLKMIEHLKSIVNEGYIVHDDSIMNMQDEIIIDDSDIETSEEEEDAEEPVEISQFNSTPGKRAQAVFKEEGEEDDPNIIKYDIEEPDTVESKDIKKENQKESIPKHESTPEVQTSKQTTVIEEIEQQKVEPKGETSVKKADSFKVEENNPSPSSNRFQLKGKKEKQNPVSDQSKAESETKTTEMKEEQSSIGVLGPTKKTPEVAPTVHQDTTNKPDHDEVHQDQVDYGDEDQEVA
jgi:hypothetical protein